MSDTEVKTMEEIIIELIVYTAIPFNITERPSFRRFLESIRVNASSKLLGRTKIKESLLMNCANIAVALMEELIASVLRKGHRAGMVLVGWSDVNKLHIEGVIITAGSAATCALDAKEADFEQHGIAVARG